MNLFELLVKIGVDSTALETGIQKAGTVVKGFAKLAGAAVGAGATAVAALTKASVSSFAEYEQLVGGVEKIFNEMDTSKIINDAANAYKTLGISANEYLTTINDMGAAFSTNMGDAAGYEVAQKGLEAISNFASGTGKSVDLLSEKLTLITRATSSYQSIADQFSGILPATSKGFLEEAQAAGYLSDKYKALTDVPIAEYQAAVIDMMTDGVAALGLAGNTQLEAFSTISGSLAMLKASWSNWTTALADDNADLSAYTDNLVTSANAVITNVMPRIQTVFDSLSSALATQLPAVLNMAISTITSNLPKLVASGAALAAAVLNGLVSAIPQVVEAIPEMVASIVAAFSAGFDADIVGMITGLISNISGWIGESIPTIVSAITTGLPTLMASLGEIISSIVSAFTDNADALFEAGLKILSFLANGIISAIPELAAKIPEVINGIVSFISAHLPEIIDTGIQILMSLVEGITTAIPLIIAAIPQLIISIVSAIGENLPTIIAGGIQILGALIKGIISAIPTLISAVGEVVKAFVNKMRESSKVFDAIANAAEAAWELIKTVWNAVAPYFEYVFSQISNVATTVWNVIKTTVTFVWDAIKAVWNTAVSFFTAVWNSIAGVFSAVSSVLSGHFRDAWEAIKGIVSTWADFFKELWGNIKAVFADAVNAGAEIVENIKKGISNAWNNLVSWFNGIWDSLFGSRTVNVNVNKRGGETTRAGGLDYVPYDGYPAILHRGEAVLTQREAAAWKSGGNGGNIINIYPQTLDEATIDYLYNRFNAQMGATT